MSIKNCKILTSLAIFSLLSSIFFCSFLFCWGNYIYIGCLSNDGYIYVSSCNGLLELAVNASATPQVLELNPNFRFADIVGIVDDLWVFNLYKSDDVIVFRCSYIILTLTTFFLISIIYLIYVITTPRISGNSINGVRCGVSIKRFFIFL